ncbi:MAG: site-2 protease family protein, partial [Anaerolineae bacterium]|nr:site-2 protease family protein [Anaerolineae bacterium]
MSILQSVGGGILGFVVALVPLIILHELGHMFAAKSLGVWVREFGIGYPPRMLKLFKWQETVFTLNWLPIGGFARMEGEEFVEQDAAMAEHEVDEDRPSIEEVRAHSLYAQSPFRRILIYLAGPAMNLLTAWVLSILIFAVVVPTTDVHIA